MIFPYAGEVDDVFMFSDVTSQYVSYFSDGLTIGNILFIHSFIHSSFFSFLSLLLLF